MHRFRKSPEEVMMNDILASSSKRIQSAQTGTATFPYYSYPVPAPGAGAGMVPFPGVTMGGGPPQYPAPPGSGYGPTPGTAPVGVAAGPESNSPASQTSEMQRLNNLLSSASTRPAPSR
jgi:hypothetical protein